MKKPSVKDYDWHSSNAARTSSKNASTHRDIVEKNDRAKHGSQRPWIDKDGAIHFY